MNFHGFDIETKGVLPEYALQAYRAQRLQPTFDGEPFCAWISAASVASTTQAVGFHDPSVQQLTTMLTPFAGKHLIAWNTCFDVSWLYAVGVPVELIESIKWLDGMLLWMHVTREPESEKSKKKSYSLEAAMNEFYPEQAGFKDFKDFQADSPEALAGLLHRNKEDARFTAILAEQFWNRLGPGQQRAALIEASCIPAVAQTYNRGITLDPAALVLLRNKLEKEGAEAYAALKEHHPGIDSVNLGSPKQVGDLLYNQWGLTPPKLTPTGNPATDKFALFDLAETYPQAKLLRDYRESQYNLAKYVTAKEQSLLYNEDGVSRPQAKIFGTYTSRMTYYSKQGKGKAEKPTGFSLHQEKRGPDFRNVIIPPPGYDLIEVDFAGQEFRIMAVASGDERMLELCQPGEDAHSYMGSQIANVEYRDLIVRVKAEDKEAAIQRKLGKFCNLSYQFRISYKTATIKAKVEYGLNLLEAFVKASLNTYKRSYPGVPHYWQEAIFKSSKCCYAETFAGRRINLNGDWRNHKTAWALESTAINYPVQGSGGEMKYLALAVAKNILTRHSSYLYFELHDGIYVISPHAKTKACFTELRNALSNLPYKQLWGRDFPIKFPVDGKVGPSWGQLREPEWL